ncbi:MAG: Mut7-C ubiquitin/RNAse domain-containing protein, partial [Proteobacteria bacterium]|nr:Mut7-C ubiquitin/RNAse domain-containing protein [Pseudomonadota bacterium]
FLPEVQRKVSFRHSFHGTPSIKDIVQAIGVPHAAIDLILVDGRSVDFAHRLRGGERIAVYPVFERLDISPVIRLRPKPLRDTRFILDVHLGKLARYLRMLGFDAAYDRDWDDNTIIDQSLEQKRIILTRDIGLLKQSRVTHSYWLRHHQPLEQLQELLLSLDLSRQLRPFTRCMDCNGQIQQVARNKISTQVEAEIFQRFEAFRRCRHCRKIYWQGSHYHRMRERISKIELTLISARCCPRHHRR